MIAMGFDATTSAKALQMASNNIDLAIDLISSGDIGSMQHHVHQSHGKQPALTKQPLNPGPNMAQQNPNNQQALLTALLAQLQSHPEMLAGLQNNPGQLQNMMNAQPRMVEIPAVLEPKDAEAVNRLKQLGFSEKECKEAYFGCEKNEEIAANYLFEGQNMEDGGNDQQ